MSNQGWRVIGGKRNYYRSLWEANYARYLEWLKQGGHIRDWEHEPETFWFLNIKRGIRSYLPDFRITETSGKLTYHEVKGYMDAGSKTKLARMNKYYPQIKLILIDEPQYQSVKRQVSRLIEGWESGSGLIAAPQIRYGAHHVQRTSRGRTG